MAMLGRMEESVDTERIDYPRIIQEALRDVVRRVLMQVAENGLPGEHHFLIAFRTEHPGVHVPRFLRDMYPEEIKVILQHQFWDMVVDEEAFSVTLTFNASRNRVTVPFAAVTAFVDPSVEFGLRFDAHEEASEEGEPDSPEPPKPQRPQGDAEVVSLDKFRKH